MPMTKDWKLDDAHCNRCRQQICAPHSTFGAIGEAISSLEIAICSSAHFLFIVVSSGTKDMCGDSVYGQTIAITSNGLCIQAGESYLCDQ